MCWHIGWMVHIKLYAQMAVTCGAVYLIDRSLKNRSGSIVDNGLGRNKLVDLIHDLDVGQDLFSTSL